MRASPRYVSGRDRALRGGREGGVVARLTRVDPPSRDEARPLRAARARRAARRSTPGRAARRPHHMRKGEIMNSSKAGWTVLVILGFVVACGADPVTVQQRSEAMAPGTAASADRAIQNDDDQGAAKIAIRDDCDPTDPAWAPTGGCLLRRGNVRFAEFGAELVSLLSPATVVGHQAWRN